MPSILNNSSAPVTGVSIANAFGDSLLSIGRQINKSGIGLSASSRAGIDGFINATQSGYNSLFSLGAGPSLTIEGMQTQIKGLRAKIPVSQLSPDMLQQIADEIAAEQEASAVAPSDRGQNVDTEA